MVENVGRRIALILALLVAAVLLFVLPQHPIRLGLDLAGGVRLVYKLDLKRAISEGSVGANEDPRQLIEDEIAILRTRVDPTGVREPIIRALGTEEIEISLPGNAELTGEGAHAQLGGDLVASGDEAALLKNIELVGSPKDIEAFPGGGGKIQIGAEKISYLERVDKQLTGVVRGVDNTQVAAHAKDASIELISDDQIRNAIENLGDMRFYIGAVASDFVTLGTTQEAETAKVTEWLKRPENAHVSIKIYNALPHDKGGPPGNIRWFPRRQEEGQAPLPREQRILALVEPPVEWTFTGADMLRVYKTPDRVGFPAVSFELRPNKVDAFGNFTEKHVHGLMAITLNDEVASYATIDEKLPGQAQISGRFTDRYADALVTVLRSGSLKIKPELESREEIGATVGQQYVDQGWIMGITAFGVIVFFMIAYFRELGVIASIGLAYNLAIQMGALAAFRFTLTLPGIAGIILGIGMAVDANIMIFERIREEQESGKKPVLAIKSGFEHAFSAIFDCHVTTVLAGAILAYVGTGPIRGFAVTLIIGALTSMFSALIVARVLVHFRLKKNPTTPFKMGRWLADAHFKVIEKTRLAIGISAFLIVAGLIAFAVQDNHKKFGIDFLGGATVKVHTEEPQTKKAVEDRLKSIPGDIGRSFELAPMPASKVGEGYTEFRVTFKTDPDAAKHASSSEETFEAEIRRGLGDMLQKGPIELKIEGSPEASKLAGTLYFADAHSADDVRAHLETAKLPQGALKDAKVEQRAGRQDVFTFTATGAAGMNESDTRLALRTSLDSSKDAKGHDLKLADPIPEKSVIGRRVVGELRDSAIKALLLSLLVTVIYLRVRFAEYSWGIAAVASLIHDIFFTIGAIAFLVAVPLLHCEFDMSTIAVFLTIVGYSVNDTIIVFDRIRENLPRMKGSLDEIVNTSINQTFARTIMTSGTAFATMMVVLVFNLGTGNALENFAFTMTFGIATGTFSSIYIASPVFIWLTKRAMRKEAEQNGGNNKPKPPAVSAEATV